MYEIKNSTPKDLSKKINVKLSKKDLDLIFKWYDKGFTHLDEDKPLRDRLKKIYDEVYNG
jgi:hypothetical protein